MDIDRLSALNKRFYSYIERLPEYPAIEVMRFLFHILPTEHLSDYEVRDENLKTVLRGPTKDANLKLENPVILAAGYSEPYMLEKALQMGFGGVTAKCSKEPMEGNKGRTIIRTPEGPLNSVGYKNPGMVKSYAYLEKIRKKAAPSKRIIVNISDSSVENYCEVIGHMDPVADAFEIGNCLNSPKGKRLDFFHDDDLARYLFSNARACTEKPLILKLPRSEDCPRMYGTIAIALDNGYTILNYANTKRVKDRRFSLGECGLSGPALFEDTLKNVEMLYREFGNHADIIGTGGIHSPASAYLVRKKGAKAIGYITAFPRDIFLAKKINQVFSESGFK